SQDKRFRFLPSVDAAIRYFRIEPPCGAARLRSGRASEMVLASTSLRTPYLEHGHALRIHRASGARLKITAAIHWEALRLWLKGARVAPRYDAATAKDPNSSLASGKSRAYIA